MIELTKIEIIAIASAVTAAAFLIGLLISLAGAMLRQADAELQGKQPPYAWPVKYVSPPMTDEWRREWQLDRQKKRENRSRMN